MKPRVIFAFVLVASIAACSEPRRTPGGTGLTEGRNPGECSDGADNDGDTFFDCNDSDCFRAPNCDADGSTSDGSVPMDASRDGSIRDAAVRDTTTRSDTGGRPDTSVDTGGGCDDASGVWENAIDCEFFPVGELLTIARSGVCTYVFDSGSASGTATVDGSTIIIDVTTPIPSTCVGSLVGEVITTTCLGCDLELRRL